LPAAIPKASAGAWPPTDDDLDAQLRRSLSECNVYPPVDRDELRRLAVHYFAIDPVSAATNVFKPIDSIFTVDGQAYSTTAVRLAVIDRHHPGLLGRIVEGAQSWVPVEDRR
jgi:hypothetical protein